MVDVVFVVDSSGSIAPTNFVNVVRFLRRFIDRFNIGPNRTLVGLVRYSDTARVIIPFGSYTAKSGLLTAIMNLNTQTGGYTNTPDAIQLATQQLTASRRARPAAKKVMIVLTDGESNRGSISIESASAMAKDVGIEVFVFGIGAMVNRTELRIIASAPPMMHVFRPANFSEAELNQFIPNITSQSCTGESNPIVDCCNNHKLCVSFLCIVASCTERVNLIFVLDSSSAVSSTEFEAMTDFVSMAVTRFNISANQTKVGVVRYSNIATVPIPIGSQQSVTALMAAVLALSNTTSGNPNIATAIRVATANFPAADIRDLDVKKVMVVFANQLVEGGAHNIPEIQSAAGTAADSNIEVFAIGTAGNNTLNAIASDPDSTHVFRPPVLNMRELSMFINVFATRACTSE